PVVVAWGSCSGLPVVFCGGGRRARDELLPRSAAATRRRAPPRETARGRTPRRPAGSPASALPVQHAERDNSARSRRRYRPIHPYAGTPQHHAAAGTGWVATADHPARDGACTVASVSRDRRSALLRQTD